MNRETINPFRRPEHCKSLSQKTSRESLKKQLSKIKSSVVSLIRNKKSKDSFDDLDLGFGDEESVDNGDHADDSHGKKKLKSMDEKLVFWTVYTLKTMCTGNQRVVQEIISAADSRSALVELLEKCSQLIEWRRFTTNSYEAWIRLTDDRDLFGDDQAKCLLKLLGM